MLNNHVILKPGKEKPILQKHQWIFSGAIAKWPSFDNGDILPVVSSKGELLAHAYFNKNCSIAGRIISFQDEDPYLAIKNKLKAAYLLRKSFIQTEFTNAYRLVNGEGDGLPGLIADLYDDTLVLQITTLGMDKIKEFVVEALDELVHPRVIYEKSITSSRKQEGLKDFQGVLKGEFVSKKVIKENGHFFAIDIEKAQKTGFFLDHREMRKKIGELSAGKEVLNCFSYSGGFSVYAAAAKAKKVTSVDISAEAVELARHNFAINGLEDGEFITADVFAYLRENEINQEIVILDPPAFAKKQKDVIAACRGYKDINRIAMQKMPANSLLLTCSCSYYINEELFKKVIFQAAVEAGRDVKILGKHIQGPDHPVSVFHPEGDYLKSLLLWIS